VKKQAPVLAFLALLCAPACELAGAAAEVPFEIDPIRHEVNWPSAEDLDLAAVEDKHTKGVPGFPDPLSDALTGGTLAHVKNALDLTGECHAEHAQEEVGEDERLKDQVVIVTSCSGGTRCASRCEEGFLGVKLEARVTMVLISEEDAEEIKGLLSDPSTETIAQIRLRFTDLAVFQRPAPDADPVNVNQHLGGFELGMENDDGDSTVIVDREGLADISPDTPRRFEIDNSSDFTVKLKDSILAGEATSVRLVMKLSIPAANLYEMQITDAGMVFELAPEVIIDVLELL